ncbi:MAG: hypothetical protein BroJett013_02350 [Alphaproteobacteria bacterium]|nr:MAG: hypothetical protein BroJett013_02350 [Alphaproteobacteria bacterium]
MGDFVRASQPTLGLALILGIFTAVCTIGAGVYLAFIGAPGEAHFEAFGYVVKSSNVGAASIGIGVIIAGFVIASVMKIYDKVIKAAAGTYAVDGTMLIPPIEGPPPPAPDFQQAQPPAPPPSDYPVPEPPGR